MGIFRNLFLSSKEKNTTERCLDIGLWFMDDSDFYPILTRRKNGELKQYYLFNFIKVWECKINKSYKGTQTNETQSVL